MPTRSKSNFKTVKQLELMDSELREQERRLVLGHDIDLDKLEALSRTFVGDCEQKLTGDKRLGKGSRQLLKDRIIHWQILIEELEKGNASTLRQVPKKIPMSAEIPAPDPYTPKVTSGYRSPVETIRIKMRWPQHQKPSQTRLFDLNRLPSFAPASVGVKEQ